MPMAMMQGMMGMNPMQMAMMQQMGHMGMGPQAFMPGMQPPSSQRGHRRGGRPSSSSSSSSSDSSDDRGGVLPPAAAMAAMAAMWPAAAAAAGGAGVQGMGGVPSPPSGHNQPTDVEGFLASSPIDPEAADRLRALPPRLQQAVIRRGPVSDTRNPSAVLIARVRDAEQGRLDANFESERGPLARPSASSPKPARRSAKVTIESMIRDYRLSAGCAWMMRALPPDKQKLAAKIDPAGQADPSGYVAEQLKAIV